MHALGDFAAAYHGDVEHFERLGGGGHGMCSSGRIWSDPQGRCRTWLMFPGLVDG